MKKGRKDGLFRRGQSAVWYCWVNGVRRSTGYTDVKAALARKRELEQLSADPASMAAEVADLKGAVDDLMDLLRGVENKPASTVVFYRKKCNALLRYFGEGRSLASLSPANVWTKYIEDRLAEGASRNTVGHELTAARRALKLARRNKAFPFLMEDVFPHRFQREYEPKTRALSGQEIGKLLAAMDATSPRLAGFAAWNIATASRKGEVERAEAVDVLDGGARVRIRGTKTKKSKGTIPIAPAFRELVLWAVARGAKDGPLFGGWANPSRDLAAACRRAGIERCTTNDLRRTHASLLRDAGVEARAIAAVLRHASTRMVEQVYAPTGSDQAAPLLERASGGVQMPERSLVAAEHQEARSAAPKPTRSQPNPRVPGNGLGISNPLVVRSNRTGRARFFGKSFGPELSLVGSESRRYRPNKPVVAVQREAIRAFRRVA